MQKASQLSRFTKKNLFSRSASEILKTCPLSLVGASPLFISMLRHGDVLMYLLAIKSVYSRIGSGRVAIIDDGSLTSSDLTLLSTHIPGSEIIQIHSIQTGVCPSGGTWERLYKAIELSRDQYVIQIDADVLVCGDIPEVVSCIAQNRAFLLGTWDAPEIAPAIEMAGLVRSWIETRGWTRLSIGIEAEIALDRIPDAQRRLYAHASSGFAGFPNGGASLSDLEQFSAWMAELLGSRRWAEWGSEQIASNYVLANLAGATVLPYPRYACFGPEMIDSPAALLHFLGTHRFDFGRYRHEACGFIRNYRSGFR